MYILLNNVIHFCRSVFQVKPNFYFWRAAVNNFIYISVCIWYDASFTQMKQWNAHEVTLRAVLEMLFMYVLI